MATAPVLSADVTHVLREGVYALSFPGTAHADIPIPWATTDDAAAAAATRVHIDHVNGRFVPGVTDVRRYDDGPGAPHALPLYEINAVLMEEARDHPDWIPNAWELADVMIPFMDRFGWQASAAAVTTDDARAFVHERGVPAAERRRRHAVLSGFFAALAGMDMLASNPVDGVPAP